MRLFAERRARLSTGRPTTGGHGASALPLPPPRVELRSPLTPQPGHQEQAKPARDHRERQAGTQPASSRLSQDAGVSSRTPVWGQCSHRGLAPGPRRAGAPVSPGSAGLTPAPVLGMDPNRALCHCAPVGLGAGHRGPPQGGPSITVCVRNPGSHVSHWALLVTFPRDPSKFACSAQLQPTKHLQVCPEHSTSGYFGDPCTAVLGGLSECLPPLSK